VCNHMSPGLSLTLDPCIGDPRRLKINWVDILNQVKKGEIQDGG
jgi:hypothetical protein